LYHIWQYLALLSVRYCLKKIEDVGRTVDDFNEASKQIEKYIDLDKDFYDVLQHIGIIPESIIPDSTVEKLFSKASDAVLARAFREVGLISTVLKERADSADIIARSPLFGYTLVADAKAFRMSRTAKNQKDFKVVSLSEWRKDSEYAVLCSPYFQYPTRQSQIYAQAVDNNVCLISWEHLIFLIEHGIKESENLNLAVLWNFSDAYSHEILASDRKKRFIERFNKVLLQSTNLSESKLESLLQTQISTINKRGSKETMFWQQELERINKYSREEAIDELIKTRKIHEKIKQITAYAEGLHL
ncbi:MAG: HindIII family type II restriction endonuclease, partial [Candidatus Coprovivens sp.]